MVWKWLEREVMMIVQESYQDNNFNLISFRYNKTNIVEVGWGPQKCFCSSKCIKWLFTQPQKCVAFSLDVRPSESVDYKGEKVNFQRHSNFPPTTGVCMGIAFCLINTFFRVFLYSNWFEVYELLNWSSFMVSFLFQFSRCQGRTTVWRQSESEIMLMFKWLQFNGTCKCYSTSPLSTDVFYHHNNSQMCLPRADICILCITVHQHS